MSSLAENPQVVSQRWDVTSGLVEAMMFVDHGNARLRALQRRQRAMQRSHAGLGGETAIRQSVLGSFEM